MAKILYVIPTIGRKTIDKAIRSILDLDPFATIFISAGLPVHENRNSALTSVVLSKYDWIAFMDDDDYYLKSFSEELEPSYDLIVLRMVQEGKIIPDATDVLKYQNVGMNIVVRTGFLTQRDLFEYTKTGGEDWKFVRKLLTRKPVIKITDDIYYIAPKQNKWKK